MKKALFFIFGALLVSSVTFAGNYKLDNNAVDNLFNAAEETTVSVVTNMVENTFNTTKMVSFSNTDESTTILIAWIVDMFVGEFGVHRYVLGTKSNMWAIYTFTVCGIFGIVPVVDWFVLLIDGVIQGNGSKYMNNDKFFMWAN